MADFRTVARELAPRGGWLRDPASQAWLGALGGAVSTSQALWRETVKARFASTAPEDALVLIGDTRQIERAPREEAAAYRARLQRCFEIHEKRGTDDAYREALLPLGVAGEDVRPFSWCDVHLGAWWSTVWITVDSRSGPWTSAPLADDGNAADDGTLCDITGLIDTEIHWLRRQIRKWKWAGAFPVAIWVVLSGVYTDLGLIADSGVQADDGPFQSTIIRLGNLWDQEASIYGYPPVKCDTGITTDSFPE